MSPNTNEIAIFPLDIFLLPGESTRLHIFEDRYKQLIQECEKEYLPGFGILYKNPVNTSNYGTFVQLDEVLERYPGGEMDIRIKAVSIFSLQEYELKKEGKLYPGGKIHKRPLYDHAASDALMLSWREYMIYSGQTENTMLRSERQSVLKIATTLSLSEPEKLELVNQDSHKRRESYLINYLRYLEFLYDQEKHTYHGIYLS